MRLGADYNLRLLVYQDYYLLEMLSALNKSCIGIKKIMGVDWEKTQPPADLC